MKAVSVVGFKNSGKTALCEALLSIWEKQGFFADYLKYSHHVFDKEKTDTQRMLHEKRKVFGICESETICVEQKKATLLEILSNAKNSLLLVEGGKKELFLPRVVCLRSKEEFEELNKGLALATFGFDDFTNTGIVPHYTLNNVEHLAEFLLKNAFVLGGIDCKACKKESCHALAQDIVAKKAKVEDCLVLGENKSVCIEIDGKQIMLNPFVEGIIKETIKGMLSTLKGSSEGDISIKIKELD